jgi:hypothetical protein
MTFNRILSIIAAFAVALLGGCSSADDAAKADASPRPAGATSSAAPSISASSPVSAATTEACRSLADDKDLAKFWHEVNNSPTVPGSLAIQATTAVMNLGMYTADSTVEPAVSAAMAQAVTDMGVFNQEWSGGVAFDIERFRGIVTTVVTACEDAGVDMAVE